MKILLTVILLVVLLPVSFGQKSKVWLPVSNKDTVWVELKEENKKNLINISKASQTAIAGRLLTEQKYCLDSNEAFCSKENWEYCKYDSCLERVLKCHEIEKLVFDSLTNTYPVYFADFPAPKVDTVMKNAECGKERIKLKTGRWYIMTKTNEVPEINAEQVYYSVALFQKILSSERIVTLRIYSGINGRRLPNGTYLKVVPFRVTFESGTVRYFDVSDTEP